MERSRPVNYRPGVPRYLQIADDVRRELRGEGEQIASEHTLCTRFKLSSREVVRVPPNIAQALKLPPGALGYRVIGVRHSENGPFQHVTAWVPEAVGKKIAEEDL